MSSNISLDIKTDPITACSASILLGSWLISLDTSVKFLLTIKHTYFARL